MLVRSKRDGQLFEAFTWKWNGPKYCSWCGSRLDVDAIFTRHTIYHPLHRMPGVVAMCGVCFPVEEVAHPGQPIPVDFRDTEQVHSIPVAVRENTSYSSPTAQRFDAQYNWERRRPAEQVDDEVMTQELVVERGLRKALRRVLG